MAIIKCKMCGGNLNLVEGASTAECEYCGTVQTIPNVDDEKKVTLFNRANKLRLGCDFDKASGIYEAIVADFPDEAEAYWGLMLCKYGIEYVDDPASGKKVPTCHRSSFDSIMEDSDFEQALENADSIARRVYREEAKQIEEIRKGIISVSNNEQPYDIFICYKETAEDGDRTLDSVIAQDVYDALTNKGYRVFFSRITLEDKLGMEYEPYIFAALNSAKVMLVFGTDYEYFNAVWVKNEWSRYLKLMAKDKEKHLIPCFKGIDAYDMPKEFARLQAQDMGKVGAIQDLLRGVEKIIPLQVEKVNVVADTSNTDLLLKRVFIFLGDYEWDNAESYCEKVLDIDPENAMAYAGKLLAELKFSQLDYLGTSDTDFESNKNYLEAKRYADEEFKQKLLDYQFKARDYRRMHRLVIEYTGAVADMYAAETVEKCIELAEQFESFSEIEDVDRIAEYITYYTDPSVLAKECRQKAEDLEKEDIYLQAKDFMPFADTALEDINKDYTSQAVELFESISDYKDSAELAQWCRDWLESLRLEEIYEDGKRCITQAESFDFECDRLSLYESAIEYFSSIVEYKDSQDLIQDISQKLSHAKKVAEDIYLQAKEQMALAETSDDFYELSRLFDSISLYKDAYELREECKNRGWDISQKEFQEKKLREERRFAGKCQHCGGELKGLFAKKCVVCGEPKDY